MTDYDEQLDATGLNCPLPIIKAKKTLAGMSSGQVLQVVATDPGSVKDFEAFARQTGHALLDSGEQDGVFTYRLQKA